MDGPIARPVGKRIVGLTVAEVLLALGLFTIVVLGFSVVILSGMRLNLQGDKMSQGTQIARSVMENAKKKGYANIATGLFDGRLATPTAPDVATGFPPSPYPKQGDYQVVVQVSDISPSSRSVKVDVYWSAVSKVTLYSMVHQ